MRNHYPDYIYSSEWIVMRSHLDDSKKSSNSSSSNRRQAGRKNDIKPESTSWQIIQNVRSWPLAHTMNAQQIVSLKISFRIIHVVWFIFFSLSTFIVSSSIVLRMTMSYGALCMLTRVRICYTFLMRQKIKSEARIKIKKQFCFL